MRRCYSHIWRQIAIIEGIQRESALCDDYLIFLMVEPVVQSRSLIQPFSSNYMKRPEKWVRPAPIPIHLQWQYTVNSIFGNLCFSSYNILKTQRTALVNQVSCCCIEKVHNLDGIGVRYSLWVLVMSHTKTKNGLKWRKFLKRLLYFADILCLQILF